MIQIGKKNLSWIDNTKKKYRNFKEHILRPISSGEVKRNFLAHLVRIVLKTYKN
jgi:hypothetical protein